MGDRFQKTAISLGLLLMAICVASIAYYYVIALPRHNAARLSLEQEKYAEEKAVREHLESEKRTQKLENDSKNAIRESNLSICLLLAEQNRQRYVMLNGGHETQKGDVQAPQYVWDQAAKQEKTTKDECYRQYGK